MIQARYGLNILSYEQESAGGDSVAIMRCKVHAPHGRTHEYVAAVKPVGFPITALVCGSKNCEEAAYIWLEGHEKLDYDSGVRVFRAFTATMKVRAA